MPPSGLSSTKPNVFRVGILEVQGAFLEHKVALHQAVKLLDNSVELLITEVRSCEHISDELDGLIIPGGESTTIGLYLKRNKMEEPLRKWIQNENHVTWGTCAGMILLSKMTENQKSGGQASLGIMDTDVSRNYFGRQVQSFESPVRITDARLQDTVTKDTFPGVFIRAPAIVKLLTTDVTILATLNREDSGESVIVAAQQGNVFTTAFHPELTEDCSWHLFFLKMILNKKTR